MLKHFNIENYLPKLTPLSLGLLLITENYSNIPEEADKIKNALYQEALELLMCVKDGIPEEEDISDN